MSNATPPAEESSVPGEDKGAVEAWEAWYQESASHWDHVDDIEKELGRGHGDNVVCANPLYPGDIVAFKTTQRTVNKTKHAKPGETFLVFPLMLWRVRTWWPGNRVTLEGVGAIAHLSILHVPAEQLRIETRAADVCAVRKRRWMRG